MRVLSPLDLPHAEVRALLDHGAPVYLPVNPVEYHGPHLSLHNDALISQGLMRSLHERLFPNLPLLAVPDLEVGVEPVRGPGSRAVPYATVCKLVATACRSLASLGAQRVVIMTFHGAPLHNDALQRGVELLNARGVRALSPMAELMSLQVDPPSKLRATLARTCDTIADPDDREAMLQDLDLDLHAGFLETSLSLHLAPESVAVDRSKLPPCPPSNASRSVLALARMAELMGRSRLAAELRFVARGLGWYAIRPHPGYATRPDLANAEAGRLATKTIIERYSATTQAVFDGAPPPEPPMRWLRALTLGGRLPAPDIGDTRYTLPPAGAPSHSSSASPDAR